MKINFEHIQAAHCENGVTTNLLKYIGVEGITEPLAFGMGSGLFYIHIPFLKVNNGPAISFRTMPGLIFKRTCNSLGIPVIRKKFSSPEKAQQFYKKVLEANPKNLDVKTKMAMTYVSSPNPMQGILMLREVIAADPKNELALFNLGMLSIQSGQYEKAVERLEELIELYPNNSQGQLLLGIAYMNTSEKAKAKAQFEKVKQMEKDPAVQATVDSYLKDLK